MAKPLSTQMPFKIRLIMDKKAEIEKLKKLRDKTTDPKVKKSIADKLKLVGKDILK